MADVDVRGADALFVASKRLKAAGRGDLRKDLAKGIRQVGRPLAVRGRDAVADVMPAAGGLSRATRRQPVGVKVQTGAQTVGVRLTLARKGGALRNVNSRGEFRHPVYGNRDVWVTQRVPGGVGAWEESIDGDKRLVQAAIADVMDNVLRRLERG